MNYNLRLSFSAFILFICLLFSSINLLAQPTSKVADKIVGIVDNKIILQSDLSIQLAQMAAQSKIPEDGECNIFGQMMVQKLMIAQANKDSLIVTPEEVESELDRRMSYFIQQIGSKEKLEEYYHKPILKLKEEFREPILEQLLAQRMQQKITGDIKVSPMDVKKYYESIPKDSLPYINAEMEVGQILITPKVTNESKQAAKEQLLRIKQKVLDGVSFDNQAKLYSEDPGSGPKGGDLGLINRGDMVPEFEAALFKLKDGEMSDIIETQYGYHLIKMVSRQGDKARAKHILIAPKSTEADMVFALARLDTLHRKLVKDSIQFKQAVDKYSTDDATKSNAGMFINPANGNTLMETSVIDPDVFFYADTMKVGGFSIAHRCKTHDGKDAVRIIYVKAKTAPHIANLKDDYAKLQEATIAGKQQEKMKAWLAKTISKNYVMIDDKYKNCESMATWKAILKQ